VGVSKNRGGRPTKLTPEVQDAIVEAIRDRGMYRQDAAALVGVSERSVTEWFTSGAREDAKPAHREFYLAIMKAEAEFINAGLKTITDASAHQPKLMLSLLGRRFPGKFGRRDNTVDRSAEDKAADAAAVRESVIERLEKMADALAPAPTPPAVDPIEGDE